jgi:hypothetical protein
MDVSYFTKSSCVCISASVKCVMLTVCHRHGLHKVEFQLEHICSCCTIIAARINQILVFSILDDDLLMFGYN